jgi:mRNA-degrading endonuclease RelE of RelBE toxin-antitoxin system
MAINETPVSPPQITIEDLDYALSTLSSEERSDPGKGWFLRGSVTYVLFLTAVIALLLGVISIWFNQSIGIFSLALAVICLIAFTLLMNNFDINNKEIFKKLEVANLSEIAKKAKPSSVPDAISCIIVVTWVVELVGIIWSIVDLISLKDITAIPLLLIAIPVVAFGLYIGYDSYKEHIFYLQVAQISGRIQHIKNDALEKQEGQVSLSSDDLEVLSQIEKKKTQRSIAQVKSNLSNWYAIAYHSNAKISLGNLKEKYPDVYYQVRDTIDTLQENPQPELAKPIADQPGLCWMIVSGYRITYSVDKKDLRIEVIEIREDGSREVQHAS